MSATESHGQMNTIEHLAAKDVFPLHAFGVDISITNQILVMWGAMFLIILFFFIASRKVKSIPHKVQNFAEIYLTVLWEPLEPSLGDKKWLPFFCAIFSLIFFCNLLGAIPGATPPTANINFTASLAFVVFLATHIVGVYKHGTQKYLLSLAPSGIPLPILIFLFPIEIVGQLVRPFSLAIRLFANLFAGHVVMLSIVGLIFVFKSYWIIPGSLFGNLIISLFEVFVAFIQAFIFTFLSAFYIGSALKTEH
ncbi:F0F1 ATP synthase subunit A [Candidatus Saganbacteria bacterium]|nr:F0F1 ATP synthase subunit A [Candidatus Saganbacteria bacterium]